MFRLVFLLVTLSAVVCGLNYRSEFKSFKDKFNKSYGYPREESYRFQVFTNNLKKINEHNERHANGLESYDMGVNKFTDMTFAEFSQQYLGTYVSASDHSTTPLIHNRSSTDDLPESVDWREKGIVNEIKDQGSCGSCWSFATTAAIESAWAQAKGSLVSLSEQNLMDCSWSSGNKGCSGGLVANAFAYTIKSGGLDTESSYPYTGQSSKNCQWSADNVAATISDYAKIEGGEKALQNAVAERVVTVAIHVGDDFQHYKSGIFNMPFCYTFTLNHAVTVVGYGTDHWIIRNSWGPEWGENGYAKYALGKNLCGISNMASYPIV